MALFSAALFVLLAFGTFKIASSWLRSFRLKKHLIPSLPGLPLLGNALQVPHIEPWLVFTQWKKQYGPIYSLNMAGTHVVVLNSVKAATDLLDRRSSIYSDRPRLIMAGELLCRGLSMGLTRYGDIWRKFRRVSHDSLHTHRIPVYQTRQEWDAAVLVNRLLEHPEEYDRHFKQAAASVSLSVVYDQQLESKHSFSVVERINKITHTITLAGTSASTTWVDLFPSLLVLPEFLASWKRTTREQYLDFTATFKSLMDNVRNRIQAGSATECLASYLLDEDNKHGLNDEQSAWLAGSVFGAGSETTSGALVVFLLAMVLYPEVLKRAQEEIDAVVGRERMPTFEDQSSLPYIDAIVKEALRWRPGAPLGIARRCILDDWYDDHLIPAGTTVIANIWAMSQDEDVFPNPDEFRPERYLGADAPNVSFVFGFGRRICPGRHFAHQSLFIFVASMIWAFDITKAQDKEGNEIIPSRSECINEGLVVRPALFPCQILPRHSGIHELAQQASTRD